MSEREKESRRMDMNEGEKGDWKDEKVGGEKKEKKEEEEEEGGGVGVE